MSIEEIAEYLNCDEQYVIMLLQTRQLANRDRDIVTKFKTKRDTKRRKALREIARMSEEADLYD